MNAQLSCTFKNFSILLTAISDQTNQSKILKGLRSNPFKIFSGSGLSAKRCKASTGCIMLKSQKLVQLAIAALIASHVMANPQHSNAETYINQRRCPADFPNLSKALAKDLPDYLNRVYQRLRIKREIMTVSEPELEPLPLALDQNRDRLPNQVFLSVLERETGKARTSQRAYWLLIVPTSRGWRLAMAFMRDGQAPVVDVSDAAIATATNTWLRDYCDPRYQL